MPPIVLRETDGVTPLADAQRQSPSCIAASGAPRPSRSRVKRLAGERLRR